MDTPKRSPIAAIIAVFIVVSLNLLGAWILKSATDFNIFSIWAILLVGLVVTINIGRFFVWGWLHKHIDLSKSYPLTAIFYPLIGILSIYEGEAIGFVQWIGILLITAGVVWITVFVQDKSR